MFGNYGIYYQFARRHGFVASPPGGPGLFSDTVMIAGQLEGRPVSVVRRIGKASCVVFRAPLQPSLDLGLHLQPSTIAATLGSLVGAPDVELGNPLFDEAFVVRGDDPGRLKAFLTSPVRFRLMAHRSAPIVVDDHAVTLTYGGLDAIADDEQSVTYGLSTVLEIADALDAARSAAPPPADVAPLLPRLAAYARERNLACAFDSPPRLIGHVGRLPLRIVARRRKKHVTDLEIALGFESPFDFPFSVATARTGIDAWLSGADVEVGDAAFDRAFDVTTHDPARLAALLDPETRRTLLELGEGRTLRLGGTGLLLADHARDFDPVTLPGLIERAADMMVAMARTHLPTMTPYR